jgi:hypothetical protein
MKNLRAAALAVIVSATALVSAQNHQHGTIETTTAPMSEKVIRQRLQIMGYSDVRITKTSTLKYQINATKQGQAVVLDFHPQSGSIHDVTPGKSAPRPWTMPMEPPSKLQIREEPVHPK